MRARAGRCSGLALLGISIFVYFSQPSLVLPVQHSPDVPSSELQHGSQDASERPAISSSCPPHPGQPPPACTNAHFFPPPPARQVVPSGLTQHTPGWTLFTNLYFSNGTFFIVSDEGFGEGYWPERRFITSTGLPGYHDNGEEREPGPGEMDVISLEQARAIWEDRVFDVQGFSVLANDPSQFLQHYYHVAAELLLGIERVCTNFDPMPGPDGTVCAPSPDRIVFINCAEEGFTDYPGLDQFYLHAQWPSITPLYQPSWETMSELVDYSRKAFRFPAALFIDRSASFRGDYTTWTSRTPAGPWAAGGGAYGTGGAGRNQFWYESARRRVLAFVGVAQHTLNIGLRAMDPPLAPAAGAGAPDQYVVTYISRQYTGRRLRDDDHLRLLQALYDMCERHGWKFVFMLAEDMSREEQMEVAASTTVFVAVHGNGLTHQLLMPPHPRSAIVELFPAPGFVRDYEWTAGILGHAYYTVHNDTVYAPPDLPDVGWPEAVMGRDIPVQAETVVGVVERQLLGEVRGPGHWQSPMEGIGY